MFALQIPGWQIVVRTVVVYLAVYVGLRLMGKRELGQMTVFDLVVILLIANPVQNAMVGPDVSVPDGDFAIPHLRKEGVERSELEMAMREHGVESVKEVKLAVLETDGSISIVPKSSPVVRTRKHIRQFRKH